MREAQDWVIPTPRFGDPMEGVRVRFEVPFMAICPVPDKPYAGSLEVSYSPHGMKGIVEWDEFAEWIRDRREEEHTAESLALLVWNTLAEHLCEGDRMSIRGTGKIKVIVRADVAFHYPVEVTVQ